MCKLIDYSCVNDIFLNKNPQKYDIHVSVFKCLKQHLFDGWEKRLTIHPAYSFNDNFYEIDV